MKLVYIHQHFVTNEGSSGTRSYDVSRYLVQMGHHVTMICGLLDQSALPRMPWWRLFQVHDIDGIRVVACNVYYSNKQKVPARLWSFLKFAILATVACAAEKDPDLVFATSTPLTVGIPGRIGAALQRVPYVFEVRDLWPEDPAAEGHLKPGSLMYKAWEWLEAFAYAKARKILTVSRGFHERLLERGFKPELIQTVVLGADGSLFAHPQADVEFMRRHGLNGKTVAIYTGAHGTANGLFQLVAAAECLRHRPDIAIVLIGDGKVKKALQAAAAERKLTNMYFLDPVPKLTLPGILAGCHIGLMILEQIPRPRWVTPNKLFDYMFAGLVTLVNFPGTTAQMVVTDGSGEACEPGVAAHLAGRIEHWADHSDERAAVGRRAREVAWQRYDRRMVAQQLADVFEEALTPPGAARRAPCHSEVAPR